MYKLIYIVLCLISVVNVEAVILAGGDGTQNTTLPIGGQGWDYVGRIEHATARSSVTYVTNNWFITAHHIKVLDQPTSVLLGGSSYSIDPNSWTRLTNSVGGDADLSMFRVVGGTVGLSGLTVRSSPTSNGFGLTMIGNGRNRETSETHWNVDTSVEPWIWTEVSPPPPSDLSGYKWAAGATKRWGNNTKEDDAGPIDSGGSFGVTDMFYTAFDDAGGDEAQGAIYDSGGGVFYNTGSDWELAGIMLRTTIYIDQPAESTVYGNRTYIADMQYYAAQISSTAQIIDIDEDGIPDEWEYEQSGSTTGVVASADQDGDGYTGEEEWMADTAPTNGASFLDLDFVPPTSVRISNGSTHRAYQVQLRTDLANTNGSWLVEVDWFIGTGTQMVQAVTTPPSNGFYRVRAKLP